ncbi:MAG: hypothetical protein WBB69_15890 [Anaerolineales bacterium]
MKVHSPEEAGFDLQRLASSNQIPTSLLPVTYEGGPGLAAGSELAAVYDGLLG